MKAIHQAATIQTGYRLYVFPFSLCSIMARFTYTLGKTTSDANDALPIEPVLVNLHRDGNIAEDYLISVNPKGQVPALTGRDLDPPLTDSLDISNWLCVFYPKLLPKEHETIIKALLSQLHSIQALSLSVPDKNDRREGVPCSAVDALLAREETSPRYRQALEYKGEFHRENIESALEDEHVASAETQAQALLESVALLLEKRDRGSRWCFGDAAAGPTVLDAHLVPFIVRLLDCGRRDLVPVSLRAYAEGITCLAPWQQVTRGRSTLWDVSVGHVHLLEDI